MTLHTSLSSRSKRVQVILVGFVVFIIYCIYSISNNFPTPNTTPANTSTTEVNTPPVATADDSTLTPVEEDNHQYTVPAKADICKTDQVIRNTDPNHTNAHIDFWKHLTTATAQVYKKRWQRFISNVKRTPIPQFEEEKGIVFVGGNGDTFHRTLTAIKLLRNMHHCQLPIEVWHLSDEQPSIEMRDDLESLNAVPKDLSDPQLVRPIIHRRDADKQ
jgi:alpha 1,2-mannosyltransferase